MIKALDVKMTVSELVEELTTDNVLEVIQFLNVVHGVKLGAIARMIGISQVTLSKALRSNFFFKNFDKDEARKSHAVACLVNQYRVK